MGIFKLDGFLFTTLNRIANLFLLNCLFLLSCLPIVTLGAALTALYQVSLASLADPYATVVTSYLTCFKQQWKKGTLVGLTMCLLNGSLCVLVYLALHHLVALSLPLFIVLAWLCLFNIYPFVFSGQSLTGKQIMRRSIYSTFRFLPESILMFSEALLIGAIVPIFMPQLFPFVLLFGCSGVACLQSMQLKKIVKAFAEMS